MGENILIAGGTGLLGLSWARQLSSRHHVVLGCNQRLLNVSFACCKYMKLDAFSDCLAAVEQVNPSLVVNAAGLADVEKCEYNPALAYTSNVVVARNLAKASHRLGIKFVHVSTDHLFDGKSSLKNEEADISPLNEYARTKALGEKYVLDECKNSLIIRTNFFGWGPHYRQSFSDMIFHSLKQNQQVCLFQDVFFTPILMQTLINTAHRLIDDDAFGIYNVCGSDRISKFEFGLRLAAHFNFATDLIKPGLMANSKHLVQRPYDLSLSNSKVEKRLNISIENLNAQFGALQGQVLECPFIRLA